jgi:hypothetical protein
MCIMVVNRRLLDRHSALHVADTDERPQRQHHKDIKKGEPKPAVPASTVELSYLARRAYIRGCEDATSQVDTHATTQHRLVAQVGRLQRYVNGADLDELYGLVCPMAKA